MKRKFPSQCCAAACLLVFGLTLAGCESARKTFGGGKSAPDEFVVYKRPPLSLPPEYGLRPPKQGAERPQTTTPAQEAKTALLGSGQSAGQRTTADAGSRGLQALMRSTGADRAQPDIRRLINAETSVLADEDQIFVNKLIFWVKDPNKDGTATVVDAKGERKRIMENQALGKPITEGETPKIKRKPARKGLLNF